MANEFGKQSLVTKGFDKDGSIKGFVSSQKDSVKKVSSQKGLANGTRHKRVGSAKLTLLIARNHTGKSK